ncbi:hypothetical protein GQ457_02G020180 [Hibiscus cannabinus]
MQLRHCVPVRLDCIDTLLATGILIWHIVPIRLHQYWNKLFGIGTCFSVRIRIAFRTGRNDMIFGKGRLDVQRLFFLARTRLALWFKAKHQNVFLSIESLMSDPSITDNLSSIGKDTSCDSCLATFSVVVGQGTSSLAELLALSYGLGFFFRSELRHLRGLFWKVIAR